MPKCEVCGGFAFSDMANICIKCKNEAELRVISAESALRKTICPRDQQARIAELEEDVEYMDRKRFENRAFAIRYRKRYLAAQKRIAELEAQLNAACRETQDVFSGMICSKCRLPQGVHGIDGGTGMCWSCRERTAATHESHSLCAEAVEYKRRLDAVVAMLEPGLSHATELERAIAKIRRVLHARAVAIAEGRDNA